MRGETDWRWLMKLCKKWLGKNAQFRGYPTALRLELENERKRNWDKYSGVPK